MKIAPRDIENFVKHPDKGMRVILVYGPDQGLVKERAEKIGLTIVPDLNDPFNAAHLTGDIIADDPARFFDEVNAQSLMGGTRLIRITSADNKTALHIKDWLKTNPSDGAVVVVEGGALGPRDALRKIVEESSLSAAIPCYVPSERDMAQFIRTLISEQNKNADADAVQWLATALKGDRALARMEIEKLCLYALSHPTITVQDAKASCGNTGDAAIDDLIMAVFMRDPLKTMHIYQKLLDEDTELIAIERSLQNHVRRLHQVRVDMDENEMPIEMAMKKLSPPVFFKQEDAFKAQVQKFSAPYLRRLLARLSAVEAETKRTGTPSVIVMSDALLKLSSA